MPDTDELAVPYQCPQGHQGTSTFTRDDLEAAVAEGVLTCHCDQCSRDYASTLTEQEVDNLRKLLNHGLHGELTIDPVPEDED